MKASQGFTKPVYVVTVIVLYICSFYGMSLTLGTIELGTAYAVWSGVGTVCTCIVGILFFKESINALKIGAVVGIIACVVLLNYAEGQDTKLGEVIEEDRL